jgi:hypothetical protein
MSGRLSAMNTARVQAVQWLKRHGRNVTQRKTMEYYEADHAMRNVAVVDGEVGKNLQW